MSSPCQAHPDNRQYKEQVPPKHQELQALIQVCRDMESRAGWVGYIRQFEDKSSFTTVHACFEPAFVEGPSQGADAAAVATEGYEAGSSLYPRKEKNRKFGLTREWGGVCVYVPEKQRWRRRCLML